MAGNTPQTEAILEAERANSKRLGQAYGIALPALGTQFSSLSQALGTGGEPQYIRDAYSAVRGGERENLALGEIGSLKAAGAQKKGILTHGGQFTPEDYGAKMAGALYGNRVQEAMGQVEQLNKLYGFGLGQAQQAGSGAMNATSAELANISGMRNYNAGYAGVLGALNLGGTLYGAYGQRPGGGQGLGGLVYGAPPGTYSGQPWNTGGLTGVTGT